MVEGTIIVNDREDDHFVTTGYYDSACRDLIAIPFHYYLMLEHRAMLREAGQEVLRPHRGMLLGPRAVPGAAGHRPLQLGAVQDLREYRPRQDATSARSTTSTTTTTRRRCPRGRSSWGSSGNHDERRAINTFGLRGLRAAVTLTIMHEQHRHGLRGQRRGRELEGLPRTTSTSTGTASRRRATAAWSASTASAYEFHRENRGQGLSSSGRTTPWWPRR